MYLFSIRRDCVVFIKKLLNTKIRGQSTAEYLIILVLVSIGSIGIMSIFGKSVRQQLSNVVAAFTGNEKQMIEASDIQSNAEKANERAMRGVSMKGINADEVGAYGGDEE